METYLHLIPKYGRWDDLIHLEGTSLEKQVLTVISKALDDTDSLCAKWMPRKGSFANKLRKFRKQTPKEYRKMLVHLTKVIETRMCKGEWNQICYSHVPSLAMSRYGNAFNKKDHERFQEYIKSLQKKDENVKVNVGAIYPYDVIKGIKRGSTVAQEQWDALPNYMENNNERVLPLVDVSGSMGTSCGGNLTCMDVALSLGLYISERNVGAFHNHFLTFSAEPQLQHLEGSLTERLRQLQMADWGMNTDLVKAFKRILDQARKHNVKPEEMPTQLLILSDMEFDESQGKRGWSNDCEYEWNETAQQMVEREYVQAGYEVPKIVYWNIQSRNENVPVRFDKDGTALVSGFSPSILTALLDGQDMDPVTIMDKVIFNERYDAIEYV